MRKFTWEEYYENFYDWADSTQVGYLSGLTSFGPADEVCEIAEAFFDEKAASKLIQKAVSAGVQFTAEQVVDLTSTVDKPTLDQMAEAISDLFSREQLEELDGLVGDDVFARIAKKSHVDIPDMASVTADAIHEINEMELLRFEEPVVKKQKKAGFFTKIAMAAGIVGSMSQRGPHQRAGRRCDGDCANCPPHYGYRYGRWYYGHNHTEGCQFGGNCGGGGRD